MSVEQAKAFIEKLNNDETFRSQIAQASDDAARLKMAQEAGYGFTVEEFNDTIAEWAGAADEELSEDELEAVAGGVLTNKGIVEGTFKFFKPNTTNGGSNLKWENIVLK